jgi:hypothetical protein
MENCENRNDPDFVQAFLKKWWVMCYSVLQRKSVEIRDIMTNNVIDRENISCCT